MTLGGWPFRSAPIEGELLSSCLARNAFAHGTTPYGFLEVFWPGDPVWNRDFDREPERLSRRRKGPDAADWLDDLALRMGFPRSVLEDATLAAWRSRLVGPRRLGGDTPLVLSAGVHHRTRTRHALQFCPDCLAEGVPHFRKEWRLAFVVACERHGRTLADACGACGATVVPHRSPTGRLVCCQACGREIGSGESASGGPVVSTGTMAFQVALLATLRDGAGGVVGPWVDREVFDVVRCLVAASAPAPVQARLRTALALVDALAGRDGRQRFEQCRLTVRRPWLELVAAWMADWPRQFRIGADAAGLTRRSFARKRLPAALAEEVTRLPAGIARDRSWTPILEEPGLRRLRRTDRAAYSRLRAARILEACGCQRP